MVVVGCCWRFWCISAVHSIKFEGFRWTTELHGACDEPRKEISGFVTAGSNPFQEKSDGSEPSGPESGTAYDMFFCILKRSEVQRDLHIIYNTKEKVHRPSSVDETPTLKFFPRFDF